MLETPKPEPWAHNEQCCPQVGWSHFPVNYYSSRDWSVALLKILQWLKSRVRHQTLENHWLRNSWSPEIIKSLFNVLGHYCSGGVGFFENEIWSSYKDTILDHKKQKKQKAERVGFPSTLSPPWPSTHNSRK